MGRPVLSDADRADVFRGLGHPVRRRILETLGRGECTAGELAARMKTTAAAMSQHLGILREAGLVSHQPAGPQRHYKLNPSGLNKARRWMDQLG